MCIRDRYEVIATTSALRSTPVSYTHLDVYKRQAADGAAASLLRFKDKVDLDKVGEPAFLGVVTTRTAAVRRQDGVHILPIAALGP